MKILNTVLLVILLIAVVFLFVKVYDAGTEELGENITDEELSKNLEEGKFKNVAIAFINMDTLNNNYKYQEEMRMKLENRVQKLEGEIARQSRVLQEGMVNLQQQAANLSDEQIQREQQELLSRERELRVFSEEKSNQLALEQEELNKMIFEDVEEVLGKIRKEYNLDFILRKDIGGSVLSADPQFDITSLVVKRLNENYEKRKAAKEAESSDSKK